MLINQRIARSAAFLLVALFKGGSAPEWYAQGEQVSLERQNVVVLKRWGYDDGGNIVAKGLRAVRPVMGTRQLFNTDLDNEESLGLSYYATLKFGGQENVQFLMDTGSTDVWISQLKYSDPSDYFSSLGPDCCGSSKCCKNSSSCTSRNSVDKSNCQFQIVYGSGPTKGYIGLSGYTIDDKFTAIQGGYATVVPINNIPGIVGLALPDLSSFTYPAFTEVYPKFTFQFNPSPEAESGNVFHINDDAEVKLPDGRKWNTIKLSEAAKGDSSGLSADRGHWALPLNSIKANNKDVLTSPTTTIIDSGTSLIVVPSSVGITLFNLLAGDGSACQRLKCAGTQLVVCDSLDGLKDLVFGIGDYHFTLSPQAYTQQGICRSKSSYTLLIDAGGSSPSDGDMGVFILGLAFMRAFEYTKFDYAASAVSVADPPTSSNTTASDAPVSTKKPTTSPPPSSSMSPSMVCASWLASVPALLVTLMALIS